MDEHIEFGVATIAFIKTAINAAQAVPVIGDTSADEILILAHYSINPSINKFKLTDRYNWTDRILDLPGAIQDNIQLGDNGQCYQALYLIRVGVGSSYRPRKDTGGIVSEYAIDMEVNQTQFVRLLLGFNTATGRYVL